jgi:methylenetetrahydrofolate--tRNA-(uracil-5-)-methyltransferase
LTDTLQLKVRRTTFFAGQIVGVEGYTESAAMGGLTGINAVRGLNHLPLITPPATTAHGSLIHYITTSDPTHFQPININYGLFPPLETRTRDKEQKRRLIGERALKDLEAWKTRFGLS